MEALSCIAHLPKIISTPQVIAIPLHAIRSVTVTNSLSFDPLRHLDLCRSDHIDYFLHIFIFGFCYIKTLSAHLCHCRAIGCGIGGDSGPGRNGSHPGETAPAKR